jgi:hypothetical protein
VIEPPLHGEASVRSTVSRWGKPSTGMTVIITRR